jgi:hypothetical protein
MSTRLVALPTSSCKKAMRVWSLRSMKNSLLDVGMTVTGAPLSKSRTGSVAAETSSHSLHRRGLKYIFRASAHDDFFSQAMFGPLDGDHPGRGQEAGRGACMRQFSDCCDQFRHRGMGAVPHRQGPLAVARGGKACGVATPGSAACRDPRSARPQVSRRVPLPQGGSVKPSVNTRHVPLGGPFSRWGCYRGS